MVGKKHQHRAETVGCRNPWQENFGWVFSCSPLAVSTQLLLSLQPPCCALLTVCEPSPKWAAERVYSSRCHGRHGAGVSSNVSSGFSQELVVGFFSLFYIVIMWNLCPPVKRNSASTALHWQPCAYILHTHPQKPCFLGCAINNWC